MTLDALIQQLTLARGGPLAPGLHLARRTTSHTIEALVYEPVVCLILQGAKETTVGDHTVALHAGQSLVVSHHLPVLARVTQASPEQPYLALVAAVDVAELRSLHDEVADDLPPPEPTSSLAVTRADASTLGVLSRYVDLARNPTEARVLAPLIRRELHYRLLRADNGGMLRALLQHNSHASHISRAIHRLRTEFRRRVEVGDLASSVGMSPSSFHKHFKAITSTTPLQYLKDLRLMEARRLLRGGEYTVSTAAFEVGYVSSSQFSREYSRKFGAPPRSDLPRTSPSPGP
ncbi:MAG: AraC family transcriptional regulator [Myxococcales bacterium]|nr:AraC family transcriptional regulator [Myxococcales bacterium]